MFVKENPVQNKDLSLYQYSDFQGKKNWNYSELT